MMTDPLGDLLARIRNAYQAGHAELACPSSQMKLAVARVLVEEGFSARSTSSPWQARRSSRSACATARTAGPSSTACAASRAPGRRVTSPRRRSRASAAGSARPCSPTNRGVLSDRNARAESLGGELLCEVW